MQVQNNDKGFTLIELIVVVAIMGIIGAVIIPQFTTMSLRSRMSADVAAVKVLQNQVDIYYSDTGTRPGADANGKVVDGEAGAQSVIERLIEDECIDEKYLEAVGSGTKPNSIHLQTDSAKLQYSETQNRLYLTVSDDDFKKVRSNNADRGVWIINEETKADLKQYITRGTSSSTATSSEAKTDASTIKS